MKILPTMSRGVVFLHEDGKTFELAPFQVFLSGNTTIIRIGRNTFFFNADGRFDGTEAQVVGFRPDSPEAQMLHEAFELQGRYKGLPPDEPYFSPGTAGFTAETRAWSTAKREDGGQLYDVVPRKTDRH